MARPRQIVALVFLANLAALSCNSHPVTRILADSFVETRDVYPQINPPPATVDILFVVDNSGSMEEEQNNLAANFGLFIDLITGTRADFRIAVISTDMQNTSESGRFLAKAGNPNVLNKDTPNLKTIFSENARLGTMGDGFEKGLQAIETALSEPLLSGENAGFLRPEAILAVVLVSDEEDCSHPPGAIPEFDGDECVRNISSMHPVQRYVDFLKGLKGGDASRIFFAAITGPEIPQSVNRATCTSDGQCSSGRCSDGKCCPQNPTFTPCTTNAECMSGDTCIGRKCFAVDTRRPYPPRDCSCFSTGTGLSEPGTRYIDMVKAFGSNGVYASICAADWSQSLTDIAGGVVQLICKFGLKTLKANPNALTAAEQAARREIVVKVSAVTDGGVTGPGQDVPSSRWTYNCPETGEFANGSVSFTSMSCPALGTTVQFFYEPASTERPPGTCGARNPAGACSAGESCGNCGYCELRP